MKKVIDGVEYILVPAHLVKDVANDSERRSYTRRMTLAKKFKRLFEGLDDYKIVEVDNTKQTS